MYYYFSCDKKIAIKLDGAYLGLADKQNVKGCNIDSDNVFVELFPVGGAFEPINFLLCSDTLQNPSPSLSITNLKGGYLVNANCSIKTMPFKVICQQKYRECMPTLFSDNGLKLSIETPKDFFASYSKYAWANFDVWALMISTVLLLAPTVPSEPNPQNLQQT